MKEGSFGRELRERVIGMARQKGNITIEMIIELKQRNPEMTLREASKILGCSHVNIVNRLTTHKMRWSEITDPTNEIEQYKSKRADLLAAVQQRLLCSVTDEQIKKASMKDKVWCYGVLYDKERLERGKSINDQALYVVLVERSHRKNYLEGNAKIVDAEATKKGELTIDHSTPTAKDQQDQEDSRDK